MTTAERIAGNFEIVRQAVADACREAGRDPQGVRIVGVTKYVGVDEARMLLEAGCLDLGESRPQELWKKAETLAGSGSRPRWHFIGHLQRNKVRRTLPLVHLLHSLDSIRLLESIAGESAAGQPPTDVLIEVNLDRGAGRSGVVPEEIEPLLDAAASQPAVRVCGLMGMASAPDDAAQAGGVARRQFAMLRELLERLRERSAAAAGMKELSMGMSGDFREAILEGSTLVRIGSALWEGVALSPRT